ncbi:OsmC family protein [Hoeflea sp. TYP-13]|uniref:OsmC family protein n=1 Tax=Hoeflea sp. TYP-13 TaxID=3230023 RepID=UPI0034C605D6
MKIKEKPIWNFKTKAAAQSSTRSVASSRTFDTIIDEPIERGGTNEGPMPVELVMAGLAGCTHVIANKLAAHHGTSFDAMDIDILTTMDSRGTRLIEPIDIPFPKVTINIAVETSGPEEAINRVMMDLRHHCAVSKMLQQSGTEVVEKWTVNGIAQPVFEMS